MFVKLPLSWSYVEFKIFTISKIVDQKRYQRVTINTFFIKTIFMSIYAKMPVGCLLKSKSLMLLVLCRCNYNNEKNQTISI